MHEFTLACREILLYLECIWKVKEWQKKEQQMNIHVKHLQFNIVFFQDFNDSLSELKAKMINKDINSKPDVLLIMSTSLIINDLKYKLKNKLISTVYWNGGKVIYVNNNPPSKTFSKLIINYIFEMNCDFWVHSLAV